MNALLLWILGILGLLILLWGLTRLQRGGTAWASFGLLLGLFGLGGVWLQQQYGVSVFWVLGVLGVFLLVWSLLNLRSRLARWTAALSVLLALTGFGSIVLLNSSTNLLTADTPNPMDNPQPTPAAPPETQATPDAPADEPAPTPTPESMPPANPEAPTPPTTAGSIRELEPECPCLLSVRVKAPNPTVRILQGTSEIASSRLERSSFLLEAGEYTLQVEAPGYRTFSTQINVPRNKNLEVELAQ